MPQDKTIFIATQPTPGPYEPGLSVEGDLCIYTADKPPRVGGDPIATIVREVGGHEMPFDANAALLAASWDLLVALGRLSSDVRGTFIAFEDGLRAVIGNTNYAVIRLWLDEAEAAIEKATTMEVPA